MIRFALTGEWGHARNLHYKLLDLHQWLYVEGNPVGIKEAFVTKDFPCRSSSATVDMSDGNKKKLHEAMDAVTGMRLRINNKQLCK